MSGLIFDYKQAANSAGVPNSLVQKFEDEARSEFDQDDMLFELHVLRAINEFTLSHDTPPQLASAII